jgi:hypothetical protein
MRHFSKYSLVGEPDPDFVVGRVGANLSLPRTAQPKLCATVFPTPVQDDLRNKSGLLRLVFRSTGRGQDG